jgi:hypothetical protein
VSKLRIAITGDVFRLHVKDGKITSEQSKNVQWLAALLNTPLCALGDVDVIYPAGDPDFPLKEMIGEHFQDDSVEKWQHFYAATDPGVLSSTLERLASYDLVIGFELPPIMKHWLTARGANYVSLYHHPLRFLRDQIFGVTTNIVTLADRLEGLPADLRQPVQIDRMRALAARLAVDTAQVPEGFLFAIGQTVADSSLLAQGQFSRWRHHCARVKQIMRGFDGIYFQQHPYGQASDFVADMLYCGIESPILTNLGNSYLHLFGSRAPMEVVTLSSSLGAEAQAAGHRVHFLLGDPREKFFDEGADLIRYFDVGHQLLDGEFWKLAANLGGGFDPLATYALGDDHVRFTANQWAFGVLETPGQVEIAKQVLYPLGAKDMSPGLRKVLGTRGDFGKVEVFPEPCEISSPAFHMDIHPALARPGRDWRLPIDQAFGAEYLLEGFHDNERTHVWSGGPVARVRVPIGLSVSKGCDVVVTCSVTVFSGALERAPVMAIAAEGRYLAYVFFSPQTGADARIEFMLPQPSPFLDISFEFTDRASPASCGMSADVRELGFALTQISVSARRRKGSSRMQTFQPPLHYWAPDKLMNGIAHPELEDATT